MTKRFATVKEPALDLDFIAQHTHGFEAFADDLRQHKLGRHLARQRRAARTAPARGFSLHASARGYRRATVWGSPNIGSALQTCSRW